MKPPNDIPVDQRARWLINITTEEFNSISDEDLVIFLSPLFPKTRPPKDSSNESRPAKQPAKSKPINNASTQQLLALLTDLKAKSAGVQANTKEVPST